MEDLHNNYMTIVKILLILICGNRIVFFTANTGPPENSKIMGLIYLLQLIRQTGKFLDIQM